MSKEKVVTVKIQGNGAIKHNGQYIYYKKNESVDMPESAAKRTGREYEVIPQGKVKKAVVTNSENRSGFEDLPESELLAEAGFDSLEKVAEASDKELTDIKGIGPATLKSIREALES